MVIGFTSSLFLLSTAKLPPSFMSVMALKCEITWPFLLSVQGDNVLLTDKIKISTNSSEVSYPKFTSRCHQSVVNGNFVHRPPRSNKAAAVMEGKGYFGHEIQFSQVALTEYLIGMLVSM